MAGPLSGIKVVDFARVLAGPHCAKTLLDLGAEVIKIEPPRPDVSRFALPGGPPLSGYFVQQNAGKRCISLDLNVPAAREVAMRLCEQADVVVENFRPGTLDWFGLDYAAVAASNPRVVYVSISGYGQSGPMAHRSAFAPTAQAEAGYTAVELGHLGADLATERHSAFSHGDVYTGVEAALAVVAALYQRTQSGRGQHIDVSMAASLLAVNERVYAELSGLPYGNEPIALGPAMSPFFRLADGRLITIATSLVGSRSFMTYVRAMRRPDLLDDPRFVTAALRITHLSDLHAIVQGWVLSFPSYEELLAQLDEPKLAVGLVRSVSEVAESEWAQSWGAVREVDNRRGGMVRVPGRPWRFSGTDLPSPGLPGFQGEHNLEVLAELGYDEVAVNDLVASGALVFGER